MRRVFFVLVVLAAALVGSLAAFEPSFAQDKPRTGWGVDLCGAVGAADV